MKFCGRTLFFVALVTLGKVAAHAAQESPAARKQESINLQERLATHIPKYESGRVPLVDALVNLAFQYQLPMGIEYVDEGAVRAPVELKLANATPRQVLENLVAKNPNYAVEFSSGIVEVYSPSFRADASNLFNKVIPTFDLENADPYSADFELHCALARALTPPTGCAGSHGASLERNLSLHLRGARVYEVLNAIVAKRGEVIWTVTIRPESFTEWTQATADAWYIYPLMPGFKERVLERLRAPFPQGK